MCCASLDVFFMCTMRMCMLRRRRVRCASACDCMYVYSIGCDRMQESKMADPQNDLVAKLFNLKIEKTMIQQECRILPDQKITMG